MSQKQKQFDTKQTKLKNTKKKRKKKATEKTKIIDRRTVQKYKTIYFKKLKTV